MQLTHAKRLRLDKRGFSLVEIAVVLAIVTIATGMLAHTLASAARLDPVSTETAIAASGARTMLEEMRNHPFDEMVARYNENPADDPDGPGTAPGSQFSVPGLAPVIAKGFVGTISLPTREGRLREDLSDANLGTPRDLNGDGVVDGADHSTDWILIPIRIRIEWSPRSGKNSRRTFEMYTMYARY
jgi:prepilin-type N-terminal cleavage/methylation domain-containing protein